MVGKVSNTVAPFTYQIPVNFISYPLTLAKLNPPYLACLINIEGKGECVKTGAAGEFVANITRSGDRYVLISFGRVGVRRCKSH